MDDQSSLDAKRWQLIIEAHDGEPIHATLWQPTLAAGENAPWYCTVMGLASDACEGVIGLYENILPTGQIAQQLWQVGFWLLTWNQRGHGRTCGVINVMDPEREIKDVSTLLDWAETHISRLARDEHGKIRTGMIGESCRGAVQLLASVMDDRIDAIVPITTWHDLPSSLAPADVPKGGWINLLYLMGDWWNFRKLHPFLRDSFSDARQGNIKPGLKEK